MPELRKIVIQNFRNIELQELNFSPNVNCISGGNGEGKTNLLDAIWYLSMTKSAFATPDKFNIRYGCQGFSLMGHYKMNDGNESKFSIQYDTNGEKKLRRDEKPYTKLSEHIGLLPIVMVSPADIALVSDSGEERRRFVNSVLSQMDRSYMSELQQYNRILAQRNKLLKDGIVDEILLSTFDEQLALLAEPISAKREELCEGLAPILARYYNEISLGKEDVDIMYSSDLQQDNLAEILKSRREKDRALRFTTAGVQRDDFIFLMNGHPIRRSGSQGQQKSFLVSLKFAQYELMRERYGYAPIMLLDDLFDKLDPVRVRALLSIVSNKDFGQIFITDPDKNRTANLVDAITADRTFIETKGGVFTINNE